MTKVVSLVLLCIGVANSFAFDICYPNPTNNATASLLQNVRSINFTCANCAKVTTLCLCCTPPFGNFSDSTLFQLHNNEVLEYNDGLHSSLFIFSCSPKFSFRWLFSDTRTGRQIFTFNHPELCQSALSTGSLVTIISIFTLIGVFGLYLLIGATVNYAVKGCRGLDVLPNSRFWCGCKDRISTRFKRDQYPQDYLPTHDNVLYSKLQEESFEPVEASVVQPLTETQTTTAHQDDDDDDLLLI